MILFLILDQYLSRASNETFKTWWNKWVLYRIPRHFLWIPIHFFLGVFLLSRLLLIGLDSFLLELVVFFGVLIVYGLAYLTLLLRLFTKWNKRYILATLAPFEDQFDKSNVIN